MRRFLTLVWLEHRRNWIWSLPLLGSLLFWAWGIEQVALETVEQRFATRAGLLMAAISIGAVVVCIMIGRFRSETRNGQYQVLLMSPPSGYVHVLARFTYATGLALVYFIAIGFMFWWIFELAGIHLDARSLADLTVALPVYGIGVAMLPLLGYTLLLMTFISAYRISGTGWIPGIVMLAGTPFVLQWLGDGIVRILWSLPGWRLFETAPAAFTQRFGEMDADVSAGVTQALQVGVPIEPLLIMLAVTVIMLGIAGRIWQEVEA